MPTILIKRIPDLLWRQAKAQAALDGRPIREIVIELLDAYVKQKQAAA